MTRILRGIGFPILRVAVLLALASCTAKQSAHGLIMESSRD